jgi:hypothetical protein
MSPELYNVDETHQEFPCMAFSKFNKSSERHIDAPVAAGNSSAA